MTVNELEQAIRNLIATQPMIISGASGEVINSVLSVVYSFKEFSFRVQSHPFQDALKMNMLSQLSKTENDLVISVCQLMQERGINLMLYAQMNQFPQPMMQNGYPRQGAAQNMPVGQMVFNPATPNFVQQPVQNIGGMQQPIYPQPMMQNVGFGQPVQPVQPVQPMQPAQAKPQARRVASAPYPKAPVQPEMKKPVQAKQPLPQEAPATSKPKNPKKDAVDSLVGEFQGEQGGNAAGRDYLLELLKK